MGFVFKKMMQINQVCFRNKYSLQVCVFGSIRGIQMIETERGDKACFIPTFWITDLSLLIIIQLSLLWVLIPWCKY